MMESRAGKSALPTRALFAFGNGSAQAFAGANCYRLFKFSEGVMNPGGGIGSGGFWDGM